MVLPFANLPEDATPIAGGKGASLGRMSAAGFPVPPGFVVCAPAFRDFLDAHNTLDKVTRLTSGIDVNDARALDDVSHELRTAILANPLPERLQRDIRHSYSGLGPDGPVAVRSSAVCEDGETASFAGQQETF